jgi:ribosomal protein S18 acetylase RimI-like enzyme
VDILHHCGARVMIDVQIRRAKNSDLNAILQLNQDLFEYEFKRFDNTLNCKWTCENRRYFRKSMHSRNSLLLVSTTNEKIIGYLLGTIETPATYRTIKKIGILQNTFILGKYRRQEIGTKMFSKFKKWAKNSGVNRIRVVASSKNKKAIEYYKKNGFFEYDVVLEKNI